MHKLLRITTTDDSLLNQLKGQLRYLSSYFEVVGVANDSGKLAQVTEREGIRTEAVPMRREISLWADCRSLWQLIRLFQREKPYIVHANTPKASLLSMVAAFLCRVPHRIYLVTGLRFETTHGLLRFILKTMERITAFCATRVIPEGEGVKATLLREKITRKPMQKIHNGNINGVDLAWYDRTEEVVRQAAEIRQESTDFTFIYIGRIVRDKGINEMVEAFERLSTSHNAVRLLLLGDFDQGLNPILPETLQKIESNPKIHYVGYQQDVRPWLVASDLLILVSYREGFPNVVMQAGAMGLPAIVSDINGCNEIIREGVNGWIVPKADAESLYQTMKEAVTHREECQKRASQARKEIVTRFNQKDLWAAILAMYQNLE